MSADVGPRKPETEGMSERDGLANILYYELAYKEYIDMNDCREAVDAIEASPWMAEKLQRTRGEVLQRAKAASFNDDIGPVVLDVLAQHTQSAPRDEDDQDTSCTACGEAWLPCSAVRLARVLQELEQPPAE